MWRCSPLVLNGEAPDIIALQASNKHTHTYAQQQTQNEQTHSCDTSETEEEKRDLMSKQATGIGSVVISRTLSLNRKCNANSNAHAE